MVLKGFLSCLKHAESQTDTTRGQDRTAFLYQRTARRGRHRI